MKKIVAISACLLAGMTVFAQRGMEGLIAAEKSFAAYSVAHNTRDAFLRFMDSSSIVFDNGKAVHGIAYWEKKKKNAGVLDWRPQYAEISASGDFGYTTGPWTYQPTKNDTVIARGQYITIWHINGRGEWTFLVDLGISNTQDNPAEGVIRINTTRPGEAPGPVPAVYPVETAEKNFLDLFTRNKSKAYKKFLASESILNRNGNLPAVSDAARKRMIRATPSFDQYEMTGWGISPLPVPDMGYTFGNTLYHGKADNYLRIWRREKTGWKIAVEVLLY